MGKFIQIHSDQEVKFIYYIIKFEFYIILYNF